MSISVTFKLANKSTRKEYKSYKRAISSLRNWFEKNNGMAIIYRPDHDPEIIQTLCELPDNTKTETSFYNTQAWRSLRFKVLTEQGRSCNLCGTSFEHGTVMHVDHIKPRSKYPHLALDIGNLQVLCEDCNRGKLDQDDLDFN